MTALWTLKLELREKIFFVFQDRHSEYKHLGDWNPHLASNRSCALPAWKQDTVGQENQAVCEQWANDEGVGFYAYGGYGDNKCRLFETCNPDTIRTVTGTSWRTFQRVHPAAEGSTPGGNRIAGTYTVTC